MISLTDPQDAPSLDRAFGDNARLLKALKDARYRSVVCVALTPREALMEVKGIGPVLAREVTRRLEALGYQHHIYSERLGDYIDGQFGSIKKAPIVTLNVATVRNDRGTRPIYAPLRFINDLDERHPGLTIATMVQLTDRRVIDMVSDLSQFGPEIKAYLQDVQEVNWRLQRLDSHLKIGQDLDRFGAHRTGTRHLALAK